MARAAAGPLAPAAEVQPEPAYMEHDGASGPSRRWNRHVVAAQGVEPAQTVVPYRSRVQRVVQKFDQVRELGAAARRGGQGVYDAHIATLAPLAAYAGPIAMGSLGHAIGDATGYPIHGLAVGVAAGGWLPYSTQRQRAELAGYTKDAVQMGGNFALSMAKLKLEFIGALTHLAMTDGNDQARKWADWYKQNSKLSAPVRNAITNPVVINEYMHGARPQLSDNNTEQSMAMRMLENLRRIRGEDRDSFDAMLGGQTQDPNVVRAYIDHENGRRYERGLKPMESLTALERWSMALPLSGQQRRHLSSRQRRPVEG